MVVVVPVPKVVLVVGRVVVVVARVVDVVRGTVVVVCQGHVKPVRAVVVVDGFIVVEDPVVDDVLPEVVDDVVAPTPRIGVECKAKVATLLPDAEGNPSALLIEPPARLQLLEAGPV